jgi:hypothetical protein
MAISGPCGTGLVDWSGNVGSGRVQAMNRQDDIVTAKRVEPAEAGNLEAPPLRTSVRDPDIECLRALFHRLNNQLGIVLANSELLEARVTDPAARARAAQIVESALEAMATVRDLRSRIEPASDGS